MVILLLQQVHQVAKLFSNETRTLTSMLQGEEVRSIVRQDVPGSKRTFVMNLMLSLNVLSMISDAVPLPEAIDNVRKATANVAISKIRPRSNGLMV
ncbi:hypothetical protein LTR37_014653 [Vermiconidia calcicola]|uniref:Uncharacterized protein n=1 Tax=Vermiconidia calcicola TaxID=1690605 RepID=A0ACC3MT21_9PEZI|nr:hypothetical protein LTR37_014653 [Vermiconidia calcicola]